ncbi:MAG TPA: hypothetical protein VGX23_36955 [Actinocrinis sp.]|nr:hypothetical protein [Actinocrinis sp.]
MSTLTPPVVGALVRRYPLPAPDADDRFTFGLFLDVAKALESHGYPALTGPDLVDLGQALYRLLYTTPDTAADAEHDRDEVPSAMVVHLLLTAREAVAAGTLGLVSRCGATSEAGSFQRHRITCPACLATLAAQGGAER